MDTNTHNKVFSSERMQKYLHLHKNNDTKATIHYKANLLLSESFYPLLSIFEVALRNSLNRELIKHFETTEWYFSISQTPGLKDLNQELIVAQKHITKRGEIITSSKIVAERTLGFWVRLLNSEYEKILWKSIRLAFPYLPKPERKRHNVSVPLNNIRNFRNRVYHNEPISWSFDKLEEIHTEILMVLGWLNSQLPDYAKGITRFKEVLNQVKNDLKSY